MIGVILLARVILKKMVHKIILVFQPINRYFKIGNSYYVLLLKSKRLSAESTTPPSAPNNFLNPSLNYLGTKVRVKVSGSGLKQDKITYTHQKIVNIYIVYKINKKDGTTSSDPTLENCLFGGVTLTKNVGIKIKFFISRWWIWSKCINFGGRYKFFCTYS